MNITLTHIATIPNGKNCTYDGKNSNSTRTINKTIVPRACCQDVRLTSAREWYLYIPVAWIKARDISIDQFNLYIGYIIDVAKIHFNTTVTYLGIEKQSIGMYNSSSHRTVSNCHIIAIQNHDYMDYYSYKQYIVFVLLRNLFISFGWINAKNLIQALELHLDETFSFEELLFLSYNCPNVKEQDGYYFNSDNFIIQPGSKIHKQFIKRLNNVEMNKNISLSSISSIESCITKIYSMKTYEDYFDIDKLKEFFTINIIL